jgi:hypothetical protein
MPQVITPSPACVSGLFLKSRRRQPKALGLVNGRLVKHSLSPRNTKPQEGVIVIEHTKDCLLKEAGQCTCDAMTDEQIDDELLEKEEAKD